MQVEFGVWRGNAIRTARNAAHDAAHLGLKALEEARDGR